MEPDLLATSGGGEATSGVKVRPIARAHGASVIYIHFGHLANSRNILLTSYSSPRVDRFSGRALNLGFGNYSSYIIINAQQVERSAWSL